MVTQELINYINQNLSKGLARDQIKATLLKSNWSENDIIQAFDSIKSGIPTPPSQTNTQAAPDHQTKTILVIVMLLFFYPIGVILMWIWMKEWPKWIKIFLTSPILLTIIAILGILATIIIVAVNPVNRIKQSTNTLPSYSSPTPTIYVFPTAIPTEAIEAPIASPTGILR